MDSETVIQGQNQMPPMQGPGVGPGQGGPGMFDPSMGPGQFDGQMQAMMAQMQQGGVPVPQPVQPMPAPMPYQSASLYVGDLHPDVTEALLFDIFNPVGPVASIRVCRDAVTRRSLGYAYLNFHSNNDAERALDTMNYTLIKDRPCRIMWSQRDPSLRKNGAGNVFVKHLDLSIDNKALYDTFSLFGNILSCKVVTDVHGKSRGYGFVHFETVEAADEAIKKINGMLIAGKEVFVGKFLKKDNRPNGKEWTNLYVKNMPRHWDTNAFEDFFASCGAISSAIIMTDEKGENKGFGFIDFVEHEGAEKAIEMFDGYEITVEIPKKEKKEKTSKKEVSEKGKEKEKDELTSSKDSAAGDDNKENAKSKTNAKDGEKKPDAGEDDKAPKDDEKETETKKLVMVVCRAQKKSERQRELVQKFEELKVEKQREYQGVNLYIKNLDDRVDDDILRKEFAQFGNITSARVMRDRVPATEGKKQNGTSKGFGFICYTAPEEAIKAVTEMNGKLLFGKPIYVALAQRKEQRRAQLEAQHRQQQRMMSVNGMGAAPLQPGMAPGIYPFNNQMAQPPMFQRYPGMNPNMPQGMNMPPNMMPANMPQNMGFQGMNVNGVIPPNDIPQAPAGSGANAQNAPSSGGPNGRPTGPPRGMPQQFQGRNGPQGPGPVQGQNAGRGLGAPNMPPRAPMGQMNMAQNVQFNRNARNTGAGGMTIGNMPGMQQNGISRGPPMQRGHAQMEESPLDPAILADASPSDRKALIGEKLYPLVSRLEPVAAAKITGMLLEMDNPELLHLLESHDALVAKVREALDVLQKANSNK